MRQLYLENAAGERVDLNDPRSIVASNLKGFGIVRAPAMVSLTHGFFAVTDEKEQPQESCGFDLNFVGADSYADYRAFVSWLSAASELRLVYEPYGDTEFFRRVKVTTLSKTEQNKVRWLVCEFDLVCLTPWYASTYLDVRCSGSAAGTMRYPFAYSAQLIYGTDAAGSYAAQVTNPGHAPADLTLEITGRCADPEIRLTDAGTGEVYGRLKIYADFDEGDTLVVDTDYTDTRIYRRAQNGSTEDLMNAVDLSSDPVLRIPQGATCDLQIISSAELSITPSASAKSYYWSV